MLKDKNKPKPAKPTVTQVVSATRTPQMLFFDTGSFVLLLDITASPTAQFASATCFDENGQNPTDWPRKLAASQDKVFTINGAQILRVILVAHAPVPPQQLDGKKHLFSGTGQLVITMNPSTTTAPTISVTPDPVNPCA